MVERAELLFRAPLSYRLETCIFGLSAKELRTEPRISIRQCTVKRLDAALVDFALSRTGLVGCPSI